MSDFRIDNEFRSRIPPLTTEEKNGLESSLESEGCRDALLAWANSDDPDGAALLIDGHHRYDICEEFGIKYRVKRLKFKDRAEVLDWIDANQLGRRNLNPDQVRLIRGRRYNYAKQSVGGQIPGKGVGQNDPPIRTSETLAVEYNVSEKTIRRDGKTAEWLAQHPEDEKAVIAGTKTITDVKREHKDKQRTAKRKQAAKAIEAAPTINDALKAAKFSTIVIDPPWDWGDEGDNSQMGRGRTTYGEMSHQQLLEFPVGDKADKDAHLYLWITNRSLPKGFTLLDAWGFRYITCITWCKPSIGMGNYFRGSTEHILFGVRGTLPLKAKNVGTWFSARRGKQHSSKPGEFYTIVEKCSPGPYLDIFARNDRKGWVCWGGEL